MILPLAGQAVPLTAEGQIGLRSQLRGASRANDFVGGSVAARRWRHRQSFFGVVAPRMRLRE
jgi:hypothetical protein